MNKLISIVTLIALTHSASAQVILPTDGATLNRLHIQVRWEKIEPLVGDYTLQIVEDDGSPNPFAGANPVLNYVAPAAESRLFVTSGLEFGADYAWKASGTTQTNPTVVQETPIRRFSTIEIPDYVPTPIVTTPPGANPPQPGLTLSNLSIPSLGAWGFFFVTDLDGKIVMLLEMPGILTGDVRLLDSGRLLLMKRTNDITSFRGNAQEVTLNGLEAWDASYGNNKVHHEAFDMPNGNVLVLNAEYEDLPYMGQTYSWKGDVIRELDRHSREVVFSWSTFDHYSVEDFRPQWGPGGDWTHGNTAYYDPTDSSIYYSARSLSRVTKLSYPSGDVVYHMGEDMPSGLATFGHNFFSMQHAPEPQANGNLIVFDNGNLIEPLSAPRQTRVVEIAFDHPTDPTDASIVWEFRPQDENGDPMYSPFVGDADRQPNGNTLMQHGHTATIIECDAQANEVWRMQVGGGIPQTGMYRAERIPSLVFDSPGDTDGDWDLDLEDLSELQAGFTGSGPAALSFPTTLSDLDADDDLDGEDLSEFLFWMTGPARAGVAPLEGFESFCFGDGGAGVGCGSCPCGNEAALGTRGGCLNGIDRSCRLTARGEASVAEDTLAFFADDANPSTFCVLISGDNALPQLGACPVGSGIALDPPLDGLRCVGGNALRHGSRATNAFGASGTWGDGAAPAGGILAQGSFVAGQERMFQVFYREDPALGCGTGQNTSNAVRVQIQP